MYIRHGPATVARVMSDAKTAQMDGDLLRDVGVTRTASGVEEGGVSRWEG